MGPVVRGALSALAVTLAILGLVAAYVRAELAEPQAFADRGVTALRSGPVRSVIAEEVAVDVLERRSPNLVAARPLVLTAVDAVLETDRFEQVLRRAAITAHGVLIRGDDDVAIELREVREVLLPALRTASPELARKLPGDLRPQIAEIRRSDAASLTVRIADQARNVAWPALGASLLLLVALIATAPDRRRTAAGVGIRMMVGSLLAVLALSGLQSEVVGHVAPVGVLSEDQVRAAADATWDAFAGDLRTLLIAFGVVGLLLTASVLLAALRVDREAVVRRAAIVLAGSHLPTAGRVGRGLALVLVGALLLLRRGPLYEILVVLLGGAVVLLGLTEMVSTLRGAPDPGVCVPSLPARRRRLLTALGSATAVLVAVGVTLVLVLPGDGPPPLKDEEITTCNGSAALCGRRLDQVVFPATHNSMSAADRPGWLFANQRHPIPRQLDDGIRWLMIDPHYGVKNAQGRIRTDLQAEGTTRNRVAAELGADGIGVAERLAGRLGLVPADGKRGIYLCHSLCELGAEPLGGTLKSVRGWLERNRSEVLVLMLESSVAPKEIVAAFDKAGLDRYLETLPRGRPLPTLRDLVTSGRRLVVLDEGDGGGAPWFQPAFVFAQNTDIDGFTKDPRSCGAGRGTPDSPLLVLNNWVDRFPPPAAAAVRANRAAALRDRVARCRQVLGRAPNAIGVDFYDRGDLLSVVRTLNERGPVGREAP
ncbi:hypothetical protein [Patulibacter minatonensis]|uniref:hypothetical protein n=1 Tax=Patulibacter minatonensis TaxID=298163 RepID=UPI00047937DA|nr:hypothetical protein [Patulibacter minatonensis]